MDLFLSICLGLGLSASSGFRIFLPMLLANIAAMNGWIEPGDNFAWLATWPAFYALLSASLAEIAAYYIPFVDNLLDMVATPAAVISGTLLSASFIEIQNPVLLWSMGLMVGGGTAGIVQVGTGLLRLLSSKTTAGVGNPVVSTTENIASVSLSALAIFLPIIAMILVVFLVYTHMKKLVRRKPN